MTAYAFVIDFDVLCIGVVRNIACIPFASDCFVCNLTYVIVRESQFELVVFGILYYAYVLNCIFVDVSMSKKCCLKVSKKHFFR